MVLLIRMYLRVGARPLLMRVALRATKRHDKDISTQGIESFFETGSMAGIQAAHGQRLGAMLRRLNESTNSQGMNLPGWKLHPLKGARTQRAFFGMG